MDQVKKIARILFAQRFWILCGVVVLVPIVGWAITTTQMRKKTDERKAAIKTAADTAQTLLGKQNHPNDESHKLMDGLVARAVGEVDTAWRKQLERQRAILVWPDTLLDDFKKVVEGLQPPEKVKPPAGPKEEVLSRTLRERYRDYIAEELPKLAEKIGATWRGGDGSMAMGGMGGMPGAEGMAGMPGGMPGAMPGAEGMAGMAGGGGMPGMDPTMGGMAGMMNPNEKVLWNPQDQAMFRNRYDWRNTREKVPRTIDVLYAQEDLWVMSALMDIIAKTNEGASGRYNAVIKEISYITLGRDVGRGASRVMRLSGMMSGMGGMPGMEGGMPGMEGAMPGMEGMAPGMEGMAPGMEGAMPGMEGGMPGMEGGMPGMEGAMPGMDGGMMGGMMMGPRDPAHYRYVDLDYKPIPAERLRTAVASDERSPENAFLVVAKRLPIRIGLTIDQRKLSRFISACGNASLMVEVRQVRFNRQGGLSAGGMGGMMGGGGMPGMDGGMGMPGMDAGMPGGMGGGMGMPGADMAGMGGAMGGAMPGMDGGMGMPGMGMPGMEGGGMPGGMGGMTGMPGQPGMSDVSPHDKRIEVYGVVYIYNPVDVRRLGVDKMEAGGLEGGATPPASGEAPAATAAAGE